MFGACLLGRFRAVRCGFTGRYKTEAFMSEDAYSHDELVRCSGPGRNGLVGEEEPCRSDLVVGPCPLLNSPSALAAAAPTVVLPGVWAQPQALQCLHGCPARAPCSGLSSLLPGVLLCAVYRECLGRDFRVFVIRSLLMQSQMHCLCSNLMWLIRRHVHPLVRSSMYSETGWSSSNGQS